MLPTTAYKILTAADWRLALAEGLYEGSEVDKADGYIHLSASDQLEATAAKYYAGQKALMLVEVDLDAIGDSVVWEPSRGGALFPHIYGPLPVSSAISARALEVDDAGNMILIPQG